MMRMNTSAWALLFLPLLLMVGCASEESQEQQMAKSRSLAAALPINGMAGYWVNQQYLDVLKETRSPKAAQEAVELGMVVMPKKRGEEVMIIYNFHEGAPYQLMENEQGWGIYSISKKELLHEVDLSQSKGKLKMGDYTLVKASDGQKIPEEFLFAGKYSLDDKEVEFTKDGKIKGMEGFSHYGVVVDYFDRAMDVDQVSMGPSPDEKETYGFSFGEEKLAIYKLDCKTFEGEDCVEVALGELVMELLFHPNMR